ncbi:MAG TPA: DinB family protein [Gemmatimonadaceae bacterium]|jgi:uncharacterized damage-inducible protein DinB|nr:DinB family protein [Gemmatimonadaceae bacterium]
MMRSITLLSLAVILGAAPSHPVATTAPSVLAADREIWTMVIGYVTAAAEQVPDSSYSYRPVPTVRTFGQLVAHIAGSQDMFCAQALGEQAHASDEIERTITDKAALVAALEASTAHCRKAYAMTDADAMKRTVKTFAGERSALWALLYSTVHDNEHYGNIVTYMRMLGMVPPSSQPAR